MSLVLQPQKSFTVVRQIANHTDSGTYYVQAVIRNAYTDAIIDTLQLTDRTGQRFSKNWQVPADPSGEGFYISIVTSVYTDTGYSTKSENYGDEENTYLVQERVLSGKGGGIDAYTVRRILKEEIGKRFPVEEKKENLGGAKESKPEEPKSDPKLDEILAEVRSAKVELKPKEPEKVDFKPLLDEFAEVKQKIDDKEVTPETDLTPVIEKLDYDKKDNEISMEDMKSLIQTMEERLVSTVQQEISKAIKETEFVSTFSTAARDRKAPKESAEDRPTFDIKRLAE